jgi:5'-3' exonuclease
MGGTPRTTFPGVPGFGPKGAQRLWNRFGSLEAVLASPEKIHNAKVREAIVKNADQARLSRELGPDPHRLRGGFPFDLAACRRGAPGPGSA